MLFRNVERIPQLITWLALYIQHRRSYSQKIYMKHDQNCQTIYVTCPSYAG